MKVDVAGVMKRFSGAMIQPVMFLSVAGIMLALASVLRLKRRAGASRVRKTRAPGDDRALSCRRMGVWRERYARRSAARATLLLPS